MAEKPDVALTDDEYESARASTPNAHFTSPMVIKAIWDGLAHMGVGKFRIDARPMKLAMVVATAIEGASADVNMDTGVSQVFPGAGQRVHALFIHQSNQQPATGAKK